MIAKAIKEISANKFYIPFLLDEELQRRQAFLNQVPELFPAQSDHILSVTDQCIGCGICTQVCPRGNFHLSGRRATNAGDCEFCLACAHACPQKAIVLRNGEKNARARYRHPAIQLNEIINANQQ